MTAQTGRRRRTADGTMMALGERLGVPQTFPPGPIVEDWTDARFGRTFPATFLFHPSDGRGKLRETCAQTVRLSNLPRSAPAGRVGGPPNPPAAPTGFYRPSPGPPRPRR